MTGFTQIGSSEFSIRFDGLVVASEETWWSYSLCWTGLGGGFGHVVLEPCSELAGSDVVDARPEGWTWSDPLRHDDPAATRSAKINGIKWNTDLFTGSAGMVALAFQLNSVSAVGVGAVRAHIYAGTAGLHDGHTDVDGPQCPATLTSTPALSPTPVSASSATTSAGDGGSQAGFIDGAG